MSLLPYFYEEWPMYRPRRIHDQHFGLPITPDDCLTTATVPLHRDYYRPWRLIANAIKDMGSSIKVDKDKYQIHLDVQHFAPDEITVKTADGYIVVEGKHEEKKDEHGYVSRQFIRRYALPEGTLPDAVESKLSSDGVLTITAPKHIPEAIKGERKVPIAHTGPVRKEIKESDIKEINDVNEEKK